MRRTILLCAGAGQMNLKRTVHMNMKQHPAKVKLTRAGHSTGRWEGDTLVIDTIGFLPVS